MSPDEMTDPVPDCTSCKTVRTVMEMQASVIFGWPAIPPVRVAIHSWLNLFVSSYLDAEYHSVLSVIRSWLRSWHLRCPVQSSE